jgi:hypothetical protein
MERLKETQQTTEIKRIYRQIRFVEREVSEKGLERDWKK